MTSSLEWIHPATWACLALAAGALALGSGELRRGLRVAGAALLLAGSVALLVTLADPSMLPLRSAVTHADGSTDDPRVLSALLAALAATAAMLPAWRALRGNAMSALGVALPGIVLAGVFGSLAYFTGLRAPMGLAAIGLGGLAMGTAHSLAFRRKPRPGGLWLPLQGFGAGVIVVAGVLSVHGPRATSFMVAQDAAADTLGMHVTLVGVESPQPNLRVMTIEVGGKGTPVRLRPRLVGEVGKEWRSVADARLLSGPVALPMTLRAQRTNPHEIQWVVKQDSLKAVGATIRFTGFRIEQTDSIRMYADLEVTTAAGTEKVSPGVVATKGGQIPFSATARGFGQIAVARFDADNHRVGLMLPAVPGANVRHTLILDLRQRPALPFAWAGAALALVGFLLGLVYESVAGRRA